MADIEIPAKDVRLVSDLTAKDVLHWVRGNAVDALLLNTAYKKRIKPVPKPIAQAAVYAFITATSAAGLRIKSIDHASAMMDEVCELLWNQLDETASREWLLKSV